MNWIKRLAEESVKACPLDHPNLTGMHAVRDDPGMSQLIVLTQNREHNQAGRVN